MLLLVHVSSAQWVQLGIDGKTIKDIAARNSMMFAITSDSVVYRSTNNGVDWIQIVSDGASDIAVAPSGAVFMVKDVPSVGTVLLSSPDNGSEWDTLNVLEQVPIPGYYGLQSMTISASNSGVLFCGLLMGAKSGHTGIASSTDNGASWTTPGWEILGGWLFDFKDEGVISAGYWFGLKKIQTPDDHIYLSSDKGNTWVHLGNAPLGVWLSNVLGLCLNGNILLAGGSAEYGGGVFLSADSCKTWTQVSSVIPQSGFSLETGGTIVGTDRLGVLLFSDNGDSLGSKNEGLTSVNVHALAADDNGYIYAGTDDGIWRRALSEIVASTENISPTFSADFSLSPNYPNPFNPITTITYTLPRGAQVRLSIYNALGEVVATLVDGNHAAGTFKTTWDASGLSSGVYFYRITTGEYAQTRKMVLMR